jgi:hypothetical protein
MHGRKLTSNSGINHYPNQVVSWTTDEVLALPDVARRFGRPLIKDHYRFRSGTNAKSSNQQLYASAVDEHAYMRETSLISRFFRQFFLLHISTIAFQMELIARETPAALETLPGETPIVLWSQMIPSGAWDVVMTVVGYFVLYQIYL